MLTVAAIISSVGKKTICSRRSVHETRSFAKYTLHHITAAISHALGIQTRGSDVFTVCRTANITITIFVPSHLFVIRLPGSVGGYGLFYFFIAGIRENFRCSFTDKSLVLRSHLDTSAELRFSLGSLAETQSDHYRSAKVIRRPRRGRVGLRETKVSHTV